MAGVLYERKAHIAYITLNRPEVMNAMNREVWEGITDAWIRVRDDPEVWTAIVTGAGEKAFSAGADLKEMAERRALWKKEGGEFIPSHFRTTPMRGLNVYKPFIAAVNGYCLAGGLELALVCDIRIAAEHATFGLAEVTRAIIPGAGGTQRLPRLIPFNLAMELLVTGDRISAQEAYRIGLVNKVVPMTELMPTAEALANRINENGPMAVRAVKEAAYRGMDMPLAEGLRLELLLSDLVHRTEDAQEGPLAFTENRKPQYKGR